MGYFPSKVDEHNEDPAAHPTLLLPYSGAKVSRSAAQTGVATGAGTAVTWTVEDWDEGGWWDAAAPTRLTVPADVGRVEVKFNISFQGSTVGRRLLFIRKNGLTVARVDHHPVQTGGGPTMLFLAADEDVVAADYFDFAVFQDTGGSISVGSDGVCWASIKRIDD